MGYSQVSYPFNGKFAITSCFGRRYVPPGKNWSNPHMGIDLAPRGSTPGTVFAVASGRVTKIKATTGTARGLFVWVSQDDGYGVIYQHLSKIYVKLNQKVDCKTPIGEYGGSGKTMNSYHKHLHFEVCSTTSYDVMSKNRKAYCLNPADYFGWNGAKDGIVIDGKTFDYVMARENDGTLQPLNEGDENSSDGYGLIGQMQMASKTYSVTSIQGNSYDLMYGRRYRILIEGDDGRTFDVSDLRCTFTIEKSWNQRDNYAEISIYNLNIEDESRIIQRGKKVVVEAGYTGSFYGRIYFGYIFQTLRSKENGTDFVLTIISYDQPDFSMYNLVDTTLINQATLRQAVSQVTKGNIPENAIKEGVINQKSANLVLPRGKTMFAGSTAIMSQIAKSTGSTYYLEDGSLNLIGELDTISGEVFDLSAKTGLIGSPVQNQTGVTCTCLLNPAMRINSLFHLKNSIISTAKIQLGAYQIPLDTDGLYRIIKMVYTGDTRGDSWQIDIDAITQQGTLPNMADSVGASIF